MSRLLLASLVILSLAACSSGLPKKATLAGLKHKTVLMEPKSTAVLNMETAIQSYRALLENASDSPLYREALRRLADMELELAETLKFETGNIEQAHKELQAAIELYNKYLATYPADENGEQVHYQLAKAYDLDDMLEESLSITQRLLREYPRGNYTAEAWFRSGEIYFSLREYAAAENAYRTIVEHHADSMFYEHALYKYGWTLYIQNRYEDSLHVFFRLLDRKHVAGMLSENGLAEELPRADREILEDTLRVISPALSYLETDDPVAKYFVPNGDRPYEVLIRRRLGEWYLDKGRYNDAAKIFLGLAHRYPDHDLAPAFHQSAIQAYQAGKFPSLLLDAKIQFVEIYGVDSHYWQVHDENVRDSVRPQLAKHIKDLATHYHALARRSKATKDFDAASRWYSVYLKSFPASGETAEMNYLLAECLYEGEHYEQAVSAYEQTAYNYDAHAKSADAGYAALLTYWEQEPRLPESRRNEWRRKAIASALRFSERFPQDARANSALAKSAEDLYVLHDYPAAIAVAQQLLARTDQTHRDLRRTAWSIQGQAQFELHNYGDAETSYRELVALYPVNDPKRPAAIDNLAATIYKQGEQHHAAGKLRAATGHFLRIREVAPDSAIHASAQYDAAATLIELQDWPAAATVLEDFRRRNLGDSQLQKGVTEKLAFVYLAMGQKANTAREMEIIAITPGDADRRRDALLQAAALQQELGQINEAIRLNERYVNEFPLPFNEAMEARHRLCEMYAKQGNTDKIAYWLNDIVAADRDAGALRTDRSRLLAAEATLTLAEPKLKAYQQAKLTLPLEKSLKKKKQLMERVIASYKHALEYQVAEATTAATYYLGEIYSDFSKALMASDRPPGLSGDELEQYQLLLEEQAFQFEEKAIDIHGSNVSYIKAGIYDKWVQSSLDVLAQLYPIRYAKTEEREAYFDVIP